MNPPSPPRPDPNLALVVFSDRTAIAWMRLLPRGFRHCALILPLPLPGGWVFIDSLANRVALAPLDADALARLLQRLTARGDRVLAVRRPERSPRRKRRMRPFTCVELTIRLLGLSSLCVLTPYGLFRTLSAFSRFND